MNVPLPAFLPQKCQQTQKICSSEYIPLITAYSEKMNGGNFSAHGFYEALVKIVSFFTPKSDQDFDFGAHFKLNHVSRIKPTNPNQRA